MKSNWVSDKSQMLPNKLYLAKNQSSWAMLVTSRRPTDDVWHFDISMPSKLIYFTADNIYRDHKLDSFNGYRRLIKITLARKPLSTDEMQP